MSVQSKTSALCWVINLYICQSSIHASKYKSFQQINKNLFRETLWSRVNVSNWSHDTPWMRVTMQDSSTLNAHPTLAYSVGSSQLGLCLAIAYLAIASSVSVTKYAFSFVIFVFFRDQVVKLEYQIGYEQNSWKLRLYWNKYLYLSNNHTFSDLSALIDPFITMRNYTVCDSACQKMPVTTDTGPTWTALKYLKMYLTVNHNKLVAVVCYA